MNAALAVYPTKVHVLRAEDITELCFGVQVGVVIRFLVAKVDIAQAHSQIQQHEFAYKMTTRYGLHAQ